MTYFEWEKVAWWSADGQCFLRTGQALWISLEKHRPDIAKFLHGTDEDPFYNDERIPAFLHAVADSW